MSTLGLLNEAQRLIQRNHSPDGYNIGVNIGKAGGQSRLHVHVHLIPRYVGDVADPSVSAFPDVPRREAWYLFERVQAGKDPADWKPMPTVGLGVDEIRVREDSGAFRVIYVARFAEAVYVLHAFQKKGQKTPKQDIDLARRRFKELV